jgi:hypothetical protein
VAGSYVIFGEEGYGIRLQPNGRFTCTASADVGGLYFQAEGTWRKVAPDVIETQIDRIVVNTGREPELCGGMGKTDWVVAGPYLAPSRWTFKKQRSRPD